MENQGRNRIGNSDAGYGGSGAGQQPCLGNPLHMVSTHELRDMREAMARGAVPPDLEAKLDRLALGSLGDRYIEQHCRTIIALLRAVNEGSFRAIEPVKSERLLRVLAYVRKDDDAVPDYRPDGFTDDQQAVRAVVTELGALLQDFKLWRLRHQVPRMWTSKLPEGLYGLVGQTEGPRFWHAE